MGNQPHGEGASCRRIKLQQRTKGTKEAKQTEKMRVKDQKSAKSQTMKSSVHRVLSHLQTSRFQTATVLSGHFCLSRPSVWGQLSEEGEVRGEAKRKLLLTFCSMDSAAIRHNLCLPSSPISISRHPLKSVSPACTNP